MTEYTPTTEAVRFTYSVVPSALHTNDGKRRAESFNRWLNDERAKAFFEGVHHQWTHRPVFSRSPHNPYRRS